MSNIETHSKINPGDERINIYPYASGRYGVGLAFFMVGVPVLIFSPLILFYAHENTGMLARFSFLIIGIIFLAIFYFLKRKECLTAEIDKYDGITLKLDYIFGEIILREYSVEQIADIGVRVKKESANRHDYQLESLLILITNQKILEYNISKSSKYTGQLSDKMEDFGRFTASMLDLPAPGLIIGNSIRTGLHPDTGKLFFRTKRLEQAVANTSKF